MQIRGMTQHSYMETIPLLPQIRGLTKLISHSRTRAAQQDLLKGPVSECLSNKANRIRTTLAMAPSTICHVGAISLQNFLFDLILLVTSEESC